MANIESQILGIKETENRQNDVKSFFSSGKKFRIKNVDAEEYSNVNGVLIGNILPLSKKREMANGLKKLTYNGFDIEIDEEIKIKQTKQKKVEDD